MSNSDLAEIQELDQDQIVADEQDRLASLTFRLPRSSGDSLLKFELRKVGIEY